MIDTGHTSAASGLRSRPGGDPTALVYATMLALAVIGAFVLMAKNLDAVLAAGPGALVALVAWVVYGGIILAILIALQRGEHRARWTILLALAWGGLAATAYAQLGNGALHELVAKLGGADFADSYAASISAPIVEESLKTIGIIGLALIPAARLRTPLDGLFFGVLVGAGFQVVEDFFYTIWTMQGSPDVFGQVVQMLFVRGFLEGLFAHATYSGIIGAGIGYAVSRPGLPARRRYLPAAAAFALVLGAHALFDADLGLEATLLLGVAALVILLIILWWAKKDARRPAGPSDRSA